MTHKVGRVLDCSRVQQHSSQGLLKADCCVVWIRDLQAARENSSSLVESFFAYAQVSSRVSRLKFFCGRPVFSAFSFSNPAAKVLMERANRPLTVAGRLHLVCKQDNGSKIWRFTEPLPSISSQRAATFPSKQPAPVVVSIAAPA
jgi:hypothetical protein